MGGPSSAKAWLPNVIWEMFDGRPLTAPATTLPFSTPVMAPLVQVPTLFETPVVGTPAKTMFTTVGAVLENIIAVGLNPGRARSTMRLPFGATASFSPTMSCAVVVSGPRG